LGIEDGKTERLLGEGHVDIPHRPSKFDRKFIKNQPIPTQFVEISLGDAAEIASSSSSGITACLEASPSSAFTETIGPINSPDY
jgi:hypothetical protein